MRFAYVCLMRCLMPLLWLKLLWRSRREPVYGHALGERFGFYSHTAPTGALWIHAVSLGETRAIRPLVKALRQRFPQLRLLLTHGTATGRAEGETLLGEGDAQAWLPWDTPGSVQRFLAHFRPRLGVLIDTEVWPNLVAIAQQQGLPMVLANARMSERSWRKAQRFVAFSHSVYQGLQDVWAQTEEDAQRLRSLGAPVSAVMGNLKFDAVPDAALLAMGHHWRSALASRPVVVLATSREGEEAQFVEVLQQHPEYLTQARWWVVPRHPQRFDEVASLIQSQGLAFERRSQWPKDVQTVPAPVQASVVLGDSMGEMPLYYGAASVALVGGSFAPLGGQNLIEACACACPVVMGQHTFNFEQAAQWALNAQAGVRCEDMASAMRQALALALQPEQQQRMAHAAQHFARSHQGAVAHCVKALEPLLG